MPAMDKTGPSGTGPVGAGKGPCQPGDTSSSGGGGRGQGGRGQGSCGGGRGKGGGKGGKGGGGFRRNWSGRPQLSQTEETTALELCISALQARLNALQGA